MTSDDPWQVSTALSRLRRAAELIMSARAAREIVSILSDAGAVLRELPGDPHQLDAQAAAMRAMANELEAGSGEAGRTADRIAGGGAWQGPAADAAGDSLRATRDLMEQGAVAMRTAGDLLDEYADTLRRLRKELAMHREDLLEARRELDGFLDIARTLFAGDLAGQVVKAVRAIRGGTGVLEQWQDATGKVRRGLRDVQGRARAGALGSAHLCASDVVRLVREEPAILGSVQLRSAAERLEALSTQDRVRFQALLDGAGSGAERAYLLKALAAGHPLDGVERFGATIKGKDEHWLRRQLSLVDAARHGEVSYRGRAVQQFDGTTCGSTAIMIARAMNDPLYALSLTTEGGRPLSGDAFSDRLKAEEQRIHDATNKLWPQALGTSPWGVAGELNRQNACHGAQYDWRVVDDTDRRSVGSALDVAVGAVDDGHTVPVLIGDGYPRHYVLLIGHEGENLVFYNPSGHVVRVSEDDFRTGNMSALGYRHVQGVVTPASR